jgi:trehalose synthase
MLERVEVTAKRVDDYRPIVGDDVVEQLRARATALQGARVLHINATAFGGGVAEILMTLVPLMRDLGLDAEWQVIQGSDEFFSVTKASHNGLQGMDIPLTEAMKDTWKSFNELNAQALEGAYDFIVVHDPQPAGLLHYQIAIAGAQWIWRCHIDTSQPNPAFWDFFAPYINAYNAAIFTLQDYVNPGIHSDRLAFIAPTIDPLYSKNAQIPDEEARNTVSGFGIDTNRPLITQVSRFDPWKDPLGVIDAYRLIKYEIPEVQLALVGSMASDDPEGWFYLDKTSRYAGVDNDIHILHNFHGVGAYEVGCFQTASDVVIQKSTREGFGLVVSEALWKGIPVVGGNVGGIPLQVIDGKTGYLVDSAETCAEKTHYLLSNPKAAQAMGAAGREHVRKHFLTTRQLLDYAELFIGLGEDTGK